MILFFLFTLAAGFHENDNEPERPRSKQIQVTAFRQNGRMIAILSKKRPGHLAFGFGRDMNSGDIVAIEFSGGPSPQVRDCVLIGQRYPRCSAAVLWKLEAFRPSAGGGWTVRVSRDLNVRNGYAISPQRNRMIYAFSDLPRLDGHKGRNHEMGNFDLTLR